MQFVTRLPSIPVQIFIITLVIIIWCSILISHFVSYVTVPKVRSTSSNSRRILFEELKNYNSTPSISSGIINNEQKAKRDGDRGAEIWKRLMKHGQNYGEMWEEGCNFGETDMKHTKWRIYTGVLDSVEFDEINATFEIEILDQLLQELVDQVFFM